MVRAVREFCHEISRTRPVSAGFAAGTRCRVTPVREANGYFGSLKGTCDGHCCSSRCYFATTTWTSPRHGAARRDGGRYKNNCWLDALPRKVVIASWNVPFPPFHSFSFSLSLCPCLFLSLVREFFYSFFLSLSLYPLLSLTILSPEHSLPLFCIVPPFLVSLVSRNILSRKKDGRRFANPLLHLHDFMEIR